MKYCSKCKKVYPDGIDCECLKEEQYHWNKPITMMNLGCEAICECGSDVGLAWHESYKWISQNKIDPPFCRCATCQEKLDREQVRQDSMKYLIIDNYRTENEFCDDIQAVEKYLEYYAEDCDMDSGLINDVLILKLEPIDYNDLKKSDFKPEFHFASQGCISEREPNTHLVFWEGDMYRVENISVPEIEYDGDKTVSW